MRLFIPESYTVASHRLVEGNVLARETSKLFVIPFSFSLPALQISLPENYFNKLLRKILTLNVLLRSMFPFSDPTSRLPVIISFVLTAR